MEVTASRTSAHGARHRSVKDSLYSRSPAGRSCGPWKAPVVFHVLEIFFRGKRNFPQIVRGGAGRAGLCRGATWLEAICRVTAVVGGERISPPSLAGSARPHGEHSTNARPRPSKRPPELGVTRASHARRARHQSALRPASPTLAAAFFLLFFQRSILVNVLSP